MKFATGVNQPCSVSCLPQTGHAPPVLRCSTHREEDTQLKITRLVLVCCVFLTQVVLDAAPQAQPVTRLLTAINEYGGKTWETSQFPKGYRFQHGRHALPRYINTADEKFEICTFNDHRYDRIIHAYDAEGKLRQEDFFHHPQSETTLRIGIVSETAYFPV